VVVEVQAIALMEVQVGVIAEEMVARTAASWKAERTLLMEPASAAPFFEV
jgi:hypothetical protein